MPEMVSNRWVIVVMMSLLLGLAASQAGAAQEDTLKVATAGGTGMTHYDPHTGIDSNATRIVGILYGGLLMRDADARMVPDVAASWEMSPDGKSVVFVVDRKARFHDGSPVTAKDAKFSIERYSDGRKNIYGKEVARYLEKVDLVDDHTIKIHLKSPYVAFFDRLTDYDAVVPKDYVERVGDREFGEKPMGAGPFKMVKYEADYAAHFEAFADHHRKAPSVKKLQWRYIPELSTRVAALKTGEADLIDGLSGIVYQELMNTPNVKCVVAKYGGILQIGFFDLAHPDKETPFRDVRVRQAVSLALDRKVIAEKMYHGLAEPWGGVVAPYQYGYDPSISGSTEYNPEKARKLLAEAGYPNGFKTQMYLRWYAPLAEASAAYLQKIGIECKLVDMEAGAYSSHYVGKKLEGLGTTTCSWMARNHPAASVSLMYRSDMPYCIWSTPEIDTAIIDMENDPYNKPKVSKVAQLLCDFDTMARVQAVAYHSAFALGPRVDTWEPVAGNPVIVRLEYLTFKR